MFPNHIVIKSLRITHIMIIQAYKYNALILHRLTAKRPPNTTNLVPEYDTHLAQPPDAYLSPFLSLPCFFNVNSANKLKWSLGKW